MTAPRTAEGSAATRAWRSFAAWSSRVERWTLVVTTLALLCLWAFVEITDEVLEGSSARFDERLLLALRSDGDVSDPLGPWWLEDMMRDITALGSVPLLGAMTLVVAGYLLVARRARTAAFLVGSVTGGVIVSLMLKDIFDRSRPDLVPHGAAVFTSSFPSGHSMMSALVWLTIGALLARIQPQKRLKAYVLGAALVMTLLVGFSRVYLGVHWPTDVLAGWTAGAAWAFAFWAGAGWLQTRGRLEPPIQDDASPRSSGVQAAVDNAR